MQRAGPPGSLSPVFGGWSFSHGSLHGETNNDDASAGNRGDPGRPAAEGVEFRGACPGRGPAQGLGDGGPDGPGDDVGRGGRQGGPDAGPGAGGGGGIAADPNARQPRPGGPGGPAAVPVLRA